MSTTLEELIEIELIHFKERISNIYKDELKTRLDIINNEYKNNIEKIEKTYKEDLKIKEDDANSFKHFTLVRQLASDKDDLEKRLEIANQQIKYYKNLSKNEKEQSVTDIPKLIQVKIKKDSDQPHVTSEQPHVTSEQSKPTPKISRSSKITKAEHHVNVEAKTLEHLPPAKVVVEAESLPPLKVVEPLPPVKVEPSPPVKVEEPLSPVKVEESLPPVKVEAVVEEVEIKRDRIKIKGESYFLDKVQNSKNVYPFFDINNKEIGYKNKDNKYFFHK